jgi:hypothetical protein
VIRRRRPAGDDGVVAIVVALCMSSFLLVVGAFAVDFGNAFARRQNLQTSADLATLAAAAMLPDRAAALAKAREVLCSGRNENQVNGWNASVCAGTGWMTDGNQANGEITFYGPDVNGDGRYQSGEAAGAGVEATAVRIQTPPAHVEFGLGSITGASGVDLQRAATAKMGSLSGPGGVQPIPVTPGETGTTCLSDAPGNLGSPPGVTIPTGSSDLSLQILAGLQATPKVTRIRVEVLLSVPGLLAVQVHAHGWSSLGQDLGDQIMGTRSGVGPVEFTAPDYPVGSYVYLYASVTIGPITTFSTWIPIDYGSLDTCGRGIVRRNYINEPRLTGVGLSLTANLQLGIDHAVRPWSEFPASNDPPLAGRTCDQQLGRGTALRSTATARATVNCLTIAEAEAVVSLSHRPWLHPGGLLPKRDCPGAQRGNVNGHPDLDVTSMFRADLTPGGPNGTIADLVRDGASPTPAQRGSLSAKLFLCPRLFTVPVLDAPIVDRAIDTGTYPVRGFKYLYLEPDGGSYGFTLTGRTVTKINAILIDPAWFPDTASLPLPVGEYLGENLTKQVALVHDIDDPGT